MRGYDREPRGSRHGSRYWEIFKQLELIVIKRDNSMNGYLNYCCLGGKAERGEAKAMISEETAVTHIAREGASVATFVVWTMFLFLSGSRHDYGVILFFCFAWYWS